jgi:hypothetical protein
MALRLKLKAEMGEMNSDRVNSMISIIPPRSSPRFMKL